MISEDILMNRSKNIKGIMKKTIAVILGITMSFGSLALPNKGIKESLPTASAAKVEYEGRKFVYDIEIRNDESGIIITSIEEHGETVKIPSTLVFNGVEYPVKKVDNYFLHDDQTVKSQFGCVLFPPPAAGETIRKKAILYHQQYTSKLGDGKNGDLPRKRN